MKIKYKKPKYKNFKYKDVKFTGFDVSKSITKDTDKDGYPDYLDCQPQNPKKQGLGHLIKGHKAKKELKIAEEFDLPIEEEYEKELKEKIAEGDKEKKRIKENVTSGLKINKLKKVNNKKVKPQHYKNLQGQIKENQAVNYMIHPPQKMFQDPETGKRISVPRYKRERYLPFIPVSAGGIYKPFIFDTPFNRRRKQRELRRRYIRYLLKKQLETEGT